MESKHSDSELLTFDKKHIWHPYTSMVEPLKVYMVEKAHRSKIHLHDGSVLLDGMSSWWAAIHGYNHPKLNSAIESQIKKMSHVMFGGLTHRQACTLGQKLIDITPEGLEHIFFSDSGSVAVEVAIKMAIQYWHAKGKTDKQKLVTVRKGYHGDTFAAMSVCDPIQGMHRLFKSILPKTLFVSEPTSLFGKTWQESDISEIEELLKNRHGEIAAVILEPVVQGAGGMRFYNPTYLTRLAALCSHYGVLLIFDEIATGFGRTGKLFAAHWADVSPDIMCLGKALTGGYISFAATVTNKKVAEGISHSGETKGVLMHGPTFMGNPLACAVANASIDLLLESDWQKTVMTIEALLKEHLAPASQIEGVKDVRVLGAIGVIELDHPPKLEEIQKLFVKNGVWIRPFGTLVYTMPPYICTVNEIITIAQTMCYVVDKYLKENR